DCAVSPPATHLPRLWVTTRCQNVSACESLGNTYADCDTNRLLVSLKVGEAAAPGFGTVRRSGLNAGQVSVGTCFGAAVDFQPVPRSAVRSSALRASRVSGLGLWCAARAIAGMTATTAAESTAAGPNRALIWRITP